jgi:hypothetical protein
MRSPELTFYERLLLDAHVRGLACAGAGEAETSGPCSVETMLNTLDGVTLPPYIHLVDSWALWWKTSLPAYLSRSLLGNLSPLSATKLTAIKSSGLSQGIRNIQEIHNAYINELIGLLKLSLDSCRRSWRNESRSVGFRRTTTTDMLSATTFCRVFAHPLAAHTLAANHNSERSKE